MRNLSVFLLLVFSLLISASEITTDHFSDTSKLRLQNEIVSSIDQLVASGRMELSDSVFLKEKIDSLVQVSLDSTKDIFESPDTTDTKDEFSGCLDLTGDELRNALNRITGSNYCSIPYTTARRLVFTKVDKVNTIVTCAYTGRQKPIIDSAPDSNDMNIEHTWPQSLGATGVAKSDMHHLLPTDSKANNVRANYPFDYVSDSELKWSVGGSRYGNNHFEVRDNFKGNVARALFYFSVRYKKSIDARQEQVLRAWHKLDPVDSAEVTRCENVFKYQKNHNPFVMHPELVDQIDDF